MFKKNDNSFELISCYVAIGSKTDTIILVLPYLHIISIFQILRDVPHIFLIGCYTCTSSEARRRDMYSFLGYLCTSSEARRRVCTPFWASEAMSCMCMIFKPEFCSSARERQCVFTIDEHQ